MVSRVPHDTDKSAIHTIILYVIFSVMTIKMLGVFRILCISLKIYLRGVKCGCILCTSFLISHRDILCGCIMLSQGYSEWEIGVCRQAAIVCDACRGIAFRGFLF